MKPAETRAAPDMFRFGRNWNRFVQGYVNRERVEQAKDSLRSFLTRDHPLEGRRFLDIGSGSGLFSLAAFELGALEIVSLDVDEDSVATTKALRRRAGAPGHWSVHHGSVLDARLMESVGQFDVVYSWGVLHHTGAMWTAIERAAEAVAPSGLLYLALYNRIDHWTFARDGRFGTSRFWKGFKKRYTALPESLQSVVDYGVMSALVTAYVVSLRNPVKAIRGHQDVRGMSWRIDIRDWLGGYPYEYAAPDEVFRFVRRLGFSLENLTTPGHFKNNEYLFRRNAARATT